MDIYPGPINYHPSTRIVKSDNSNYNGKTIEAILSLYSGASFDKDSPFRLSPTSAYISK
jgi:hypothetical protein